MCICKGEHVRGIVWLYKHMHVCGIVRLCKQVHCVRQQSQEQEDSKRMLCICEVGILVAALCIFLYLECQ